MQSIGKLVCIDFTKTTQCSFESNCLWTSKHWNFQIAGYIFISFNSAFYADSIKAFERSTHLYYFDILYRNCFEIAKMQWELFVKIVNLPNKDQTSRFVKHAGYW